MPAKLYFFPSDPKLREDLAKMPAGKRKRFFYQINRLQRKRYAILKNRLRLLLAQKGRQKNITE